MSSTPRPARPLDNLDAQQDEVIRRLDELNLEIETVLRTWSTQSVDAGSLDAEHFA